MAAEIDPPRLSLRSSAARWAAGALHAAGVTRLLGRLACSYSLKPGARRWRLPERRAINSFEILIYHRVNPEAHGFALSAAHPETFDRQMRFLSRRFAVRPLGELLAGLREGRPIPANCLAVTFDDGYLDNHTHAFPILRKYGIPATIFLATGFIGTGEILWFDRVLKAFENARAETLKVPFPPFERHFSGSGDRRAAAFEMLAELKKLEEDEKLRRIAALEEALGGRADPAEEPLMMDWDRVREMRAAGIEFGAHTVNHPILSKVDPERAGWEIRRSKADVENALQEKVDLFAYPNGRPEDFSQEIVDILRGSGFTAAVTTVFRSNPADQDPFRLHRINPWEPHLPTFAMKMAWYKASL